MIYGHDRSFSPQTKEVAGRIAFDPYNYSISLFFCFVIVVDFCFFFLIDDNEFAGVVVVVLVVICDYFHSLISISYCFFPWCVLDLGFFFFFFA